MLKLDGPGRKTVGPVSCATANCDYRSGFLLPIWRDVHCVVEGRAAAARKGLACVAARPSSMGDDVEVAGKTSSCQAAVRTAVSRWGFFGGEACIAVLKADNGSTAGCGGATLLAVAWK